MAYRVQVRAENRHPIPGSLRPLDEERHPVVLQDRFARNMRGNLLSVYTKLKYIYGGRIRLGDLGKRAEFLWNMSNKSRLYKRVLDHFFKDIIRHLKVFKFRIHLYSHLFGLLQLFRLGQIKPVLSSNCINDQILVFCLRQVPDRSITSPSGRSTCKHPSARSATC